MESILSPAILLKNLPPNRCIFQHFTKALEITATLFFERTILIENPGDRYDIIGGCLIIAIQQL